MITQLELFLLGMATVIDTVLLLIVFERINRGLVADWLYLLLGGLWIVHASTFAHELLREAPGLEWASRSCIAFTCFGLLLLPSAMLHAATWLNFGRTMHQPHFWLLYAPLAVLPWVVTHIWDSHEPRFMDSVQWWVDWYLVWAMAANIISLLLFLRCSRRLSIIAAAQFFPRLAILLAMMTGLLAVYSQVWLNTQIEPSFRLVLLLSPLAPALLFVWYALQKRMMPLVMERTLVYGAFLVSLLLLHRLLVAPLANLLQAKAKLDVLLIESWLLLGIILVWPPLRTRCREAVRYLLSSNLHQIREATRRLSVELSQQGGHSLEELMQWMSQAVAARIGVDFVRIWLSADSRRALGINTNAVSDTLAENKVEPAESRFNRLATEEREWMRINDALVRQAGPLLDRSQGLEKAVELAMVKLGAMWAFRLQFRTIQGLVLLGPRVRNDRLADEQLMALSMLFDQFAAMLHNRQLDAQRLRAERQTMQQEKLSVLGLIAGSLAHELRNPLSSIRTIATLMREEMQSNDAHSADVGMIIAEIDRLTQTTQRLLEYSRPSSGERGQVDPERVITRLLYILEQLARQFHVRIETSLNAPERLIDSSDATFSEVLFNLVKNGIEAAGDAHRSDDQTGCVSIETVAVGNLYRITVTDTGRGIDPEMQAVMFEPFVTGKSQGTGLGLYIVSERIQELGGTISCASELGLGARFEVLLPMTAPANP